MFPSIYSFDRRGGRPPYSGVICNTSTPAPGNHPYLAKKGVLAHGLRVDNHGRLVVPMRDADGTLHSLQFIAVDGTRLFLPGGRVGGCYYAIGKPSDGTLCIAEGFATGASIYEATRYAVAVAFSAGNLMAVAQSLRAKFPDLRMIVCADDDFKTAANRFRRYCGHGRAC